MTAFTHAGGIVFQKRDEKIYYLIVRAKPDPSHWVIPKGHIEPGEIPEVTAVREIREETGVNARIIATLGTLNFMYRDKQIKTILVFAGVCRRNLLPGRTGVPLGSL